MSVRSSQTRAVEFDRLAIDFRAEMAVIVLLAATTLSWHQPTSRVATSCIRATSGTHRVAIPRSHSAVMKQEGRALSDGSICEFEDSKGHRRIGLVQSSKASGSKGIIYSVVDSGGHPYPSIAAKAIHFSCPPNVKVKSTKPEDLLIDYVQIAAAKPVDMGIDLSLFGLAWEMCAEEDAPSHTMASIFEKMGEPIDDSIARYRAHRLMQSDVGHLFFKVLHEHDHEHREYKARTPEAVAMSKEAWCKAIKDGELGVKNSEEFCFA